MLVYCATAPNGKKYIGITSGTLKHRIATHSCRARKGSKYPFHNALRKYGQSIIWQILEEPGTWEQACEIEKSLIAKWNTTKLGYNVTKGGDGVLGIPCSEHARRRARETHLGKKNSHETRKLKALARGAKPFLVKEVTTGKLVGEWLIQHQCARELGIKREHIFKCLKGIKKSSHDYTFQHRGAA